jgi:hypothetical protein
MVTDATSVVSERLHLARHLAGRLVAMPEVQAALLTGSLTAGLGSRTSDVDVLLVGDGLPRERRQVFAGPVRVDVRQLSSLQLAAAVDGVLAARMLSDDAATPVPASDLALAIGVSTGEVVAGGQIVEPLRERLHAGRLPLRRVVTSRWLDLAHYGHEDLAGLVAAGEPDAAILVGRDLLLAAGKALVTGSGDLHLGRKWVCRQLDRTAPTDFPRSEFRRLMRADPTADESGAGVTALHRFAQTCLAAAATVGWHGVSLWLWPRWLPGSGPLRRSAELSIRAYDDAVLLTAPTGRRVRLRHDVALVWALCDGVTPDVVARDARQLGQAASAYASLSADRCRSIVGLLVRAGLVTQQPSSREEPIHVHGDDLMRP